MNERLSPGEYLEELRKLRERITVITGPESRGVDYRAGAIMVPAL